MLNDTHYVRSIDDLKAKNYFWIFHFSLDILILHGKMCASQIQNAGIAQLVERNLAKVEVASSSLVSRSKSLSRIKSLAGWQNGYAAVCKTVYVGSIPAPASITLNSGFIALCHAWVAEFGRRKGLKINLSI